MQFDYATVGHITADLLEDGSRRAGGTAFYAALQAARLGLRTLVVTRGQPSEIESLLAPYSRELTLRIDPAPDTTTLQTSGAGVARVQRMLAWAGPLDAPLHELDAAIVHLAPVARELQAGQLHGGEPRASFVGLTAQGLLRRWEERGGVVTLTAPPPQAQAIAARCDALVVSERERASAAPLIATASASGATVLVTAGPRPNTIVLPGGAVMELAVPPVPGARDDLGAGDVFAATLFVELAGGATPERATDLANAAAAVRMCGDGADAVGDRQAVQARAASVARASRP